MDNPDIQIPLQLAELLHVTLGPLTETLKEEDHPWVGLALMVLAAYREGRDRELEKAYGVEVVADIDLCTYRVSEQLCNWASEMAGEETDFEKWAKELGGRDNKS